MLVSPFTVAVCLPTYLSRTAKSSLIDVFLMSMEAKINYANVAQELSSNPMSMIPSCKYKWFTKIVHLFNVKLVHQ